MVVKFGSGTKGGAITKSGSNGDPLLAIMLSWSAVVYSVISELDIDYVCF